MKSFNVIHFDPNKQEFEPYNVIPYFVQTYREHVKRFHEISSEASMSDNPEEFKDILEYWKIPKTFDEFKKFVEKESHYQFWSRCEYEVILVDWPCARIQKKIDIHEQIMMNLDVVTRLVVESIINDE